MVGKRRISLALLLIPVWMLVASCSSGNDQPSTREVGNSGSEGTDRTNTGEQEAGTAAEPGSAGAQSRKPGAAREVEEVSLREAVGQMFVVSVEGTEMNPYTERAIRERNVGGVLLFGANMDSEAQVRSMTSAMQSVAEVPLLVAVDQEGGPVSNAPWVSSQPAAAEVGARGDPAEARRIARVMGGELLAAGVNADFAPVVDTGGGAAIGRRSYGDDPELVGRMSAAAIRGFREARIMSAAKHFPNHGPATADSHTGRPAVRHDMETVREDDLPPFREAVEAGAPMMMVSHLVYPAIDPDSPASLSSAAMRLLRQELGFEGVVVTDDLSMEAATRGGSFSDAAVAAARAGADAMILSGTAAEQAAAQEAVVRAVESGEIPRERVYEAAEHVVQMKRQYGLYRGAG